MSVVTRFAPSPTGFLHIGGARTALFNWLYARHHGGRFLLRIEDTDRARSTQEAIDAIFEGLAWLGLEADEPAVFQSARAERHTAVAERLLAEGNAYPCYCTQQVLADMREAQRKAGEPVRYDRRCRDRDPGGAPPGIEPAIRFKAPLEGETVIADHVQGTVRVANGQLDDMIVLRADGSPTYMLSVVVDDHDMGVTHVIRGDDHLNNAFRQMKLIEALGWPVPEYAHIPLIHGPDGAKLSKRHGALGVDAYRAMGFLPEAMRNYLLRLGWSHGDEEIINTDQAIAWFDLDSVGRSAARFDLDKLTNLNAHYLRLRDDADLADMIAARLENRLGRPVAGTEKERLIGGMGGLKARARTLVDLGESALIYIDGAPFEVTEAAQKLLDSEARTRLKALASALRGIESWTETELEPAVRAYAESEGLKLGKVAQPLRAALTGSTVSPGIFEVMVTLGREETLRRLDTLQ